MFVVGVRCVQFASTWKVNYCLEEEMAGDYNWERTVGWHLFLKMVSIVLDLVSNIFIKIVLPRALDRLDLRFMLNLEQLHDFTEGVKLTVVPVVQFRSRSRRSSSWRAIWKRVWLSSWKWRFFVKLCLVISFNNSLWILFLLVSILSTCSLRNFYVFNFQERRQENTRIWKRFKQERWRKS